MVTCQGGIRNGGQPRGDQAVAEPVRVVREES